MNDEATALAQEIGAALAGRYSIVREVGSGGSAIVFLATDLKHDRSVALKVLHAQLDAALSHRRFLSEIRTTARLQHPHILPLFDSGEADGRLFFTMPFVEAESLRARLRREGRLAVDETLRITGQVAAALEYAHARRVVHRDIKPENILLSGSGHAFVADFGIAFALDEARSVTRTDPNLAVGTPVYMSPEQMEGARELDGRSDLYSLGCVVYEMLTGSPPFGASGQRLAAIHTHGTVPSVRDDRPDVPTAVERALRHALAESRELRFATMAEFTAALRHASFFEISTFGGMAVRADGRLCRGDRLPPHALACLALLAHAGDRGVPRERLTKLLWEDQAESEASSRLDQAFAVIRAELGPADVLRGRQVIQLDPALADSDVGRFTAAVRDGRLADAVTEYYGSFLEGFRIAEAPAFKRWVEHTRAELAFDYAVALERLAGEADARGDHADAVRWWRKLASQDPLNGRLTVGLMRAMAAAGDRSGAIEQASIYEALIEEEVELPPDRAVVDFAEHLRAGGSPRDTDEEPAAAETPESPWRATAVGVMDAPDDTPAVPAPSVAPVTPDNRAPTGMGTRDQVGRNVLLVATIVLIILAALLVFSR